MPPKIAFCTTCKGRAQHIKLTLSKNLADNADYPNAVFIVLDYGSQDDLLPYLKTHHAADIAEGRLVVYSRAHDGPFRMAHAKNVVHRLGILHGAEILVNLDADNYTGRGFARYIASEFECIGDRGFLMARMVKGFTSRGISGRIVVTAKAFLKVGGYDERFSTWSPDDFDFNARLKRLGYEHFEIPVQFLTSHQHSERVRFREYPHVRLLFEQGTHQYDQKAQIICSDATIANFGRFGCALLWRNFDGTDVVELGPVPTRIFGIGLHRTGTYSLHLALNILGYDCEHWITPAWARSIWSEMLGDGRSATLERHYAVTDLPLPLFYRELDKAYPGSKFVLTVREEGAWLKSVERHWDPRFNPWRASWDEDAFTHRCHHELYGRKSFDPETFCRRYMRHNFEVMRYFKDRPQDLLVLDTDKSGRWQALCRLLNVPARQPGTYPRANETLAA